MWVQVHRLLCLTPGRLSYWETRASSGSHIGQTAEILCFLSWRKPRKERSKGGLYSSLLSLSKEAYDDSMFYILDTWCNVSMSYGLKPSKMPNNKNRARKESPSPWKRSWPQWQITKYEKYREWNLDQNKSTFLVILLQARAAHRFPKKKVWQPSRNLWVQASQGEKRAVSLKRSGTTQHTAIFSLNYIFTLNYLPGTEENRQRWRAQGEKRYSLHQDRESLWIMLLNCVDQNLLPVQRMNRSGQGVRDNKSKWGKKPSLISPYSNLKQGNCPRVKWVQPEGVRRGEVVRKRMYIYFYLPLKGK